MTKPKHSQQAQHDSFIAAAKELRCDESEERFDAALKRVAAHKTAPVSYKIGTFDETSAVPPKVAEIMTQNSQSLDAITKKSPC